MQLLTMNQAQMKYADEICSLFNPYFCSSAIILPPILFNIILQQAVSCVHCNL